MATDRFNGVVASKAIKVRCVVGAEANVATLENEQTIEGISVVAGDRVLLTAQTDPIENGAWDVVSGGPWTRSADWDGNRDVEKGSTVWAGALGQDDKLWQVQTSGTILPGTTSVSITELFNPAAPSAASLADVTSIGDDTLGNDIVISSADPLLNLQDNNNTGASATGNVVFIDSAVAEQASVRLLSSDIVMDSVNGNIQLTAANGFIRAVDSFVAGDPGNEETGISIDGVTYESSLKVSDIGGSNLAQTILHRHSTTIGPVIVGARTNSDTSGHTLVTDGQSLLWVIGTGWDGAAYQRAAEIQMDVDGTAALNDMPGRILFSTTPSGAKVPVERMRLGQAGSMYLTEIAADDADIAGKGQFWVDSADSLPYFTDDGGNIYPLTGGGAGGAGSIVWTYDDTLVAASDPGAGMVRFNTVNPASFVWMVINDADVDGLDIQNIIASMPVGGSHVVMRNTEDNTQYRVYSITAIADNVGWYQLTLDYLFGNGNASITDGIDLTFEFFSSPNVEGGVEVSNMSDLLYWDSSTNRWEASGSLLRVNPGTPPFGGRIQIGTTSGYNTTSPQIMRPLGAADTIMDYVYGTDANNGFFQGYRRSTTPNEMIFGARIASVNTDLLLFTLNSEVVVEPAAAFMIGERAAAATIKTGYGEFWVRNDTNQTPMFTDEAGVDYELNAAGAAAITSVINADINTATPPTSELVTAELIYRDLADDDDLAHVGFDGTNVFQIRNQMTSGDMEFYVDDNVGTQTRIIRLHKGNSASPGQEGYAMFNRVICNYLGSQAFSPDDPPLMVTNSGGDEDGQTQSNLSMWYNSIQAYTASAAAGSTLSINPSGGTVNLGNNSGAGTASNVVLSNGTSWIAQTKTAGLNLSWRTSTAPSGGTVPNDAYYSIATHAQSHVASFGARASDNSMVLTHDIHGAPWIIEGQNEVGNPRKIATFDTTQATSGVYIGETNQQSSLWLLEETAAMTSQATWGQIWVKDDIPNTLWFTDDAGTDHQLGAPGSVTFPLDAADSEQIRYGTSQDVTMDWDGVDFEIRGAAPNQTINIRDGQHLVLWDSGDTDNVDFHHDGNDLNITGTATASITLVDTALRLDDNVELQFGTGNDASIDYDGTDSLIVDLIADDNFKVTEAGVLKFNVNTFSNRIDIHDGFELYVRSPDDGDWIVFDHDGADGHIGVGGATAGSILCDQAMAWQSSTDTVSANAVTLTIEEGNAFEVDLEPATATVAVTLSGGPPTGRYYACSVKVQQDGTAAQTLTWAGGTFVWRDGTAHVMNSTLDGISIYTFETWDGGTTWYASGADYS
jgi:hypothetical protein